MALNTVTLTWDLTNLIQSGLAATLSITPTAQMSDATDKILIAPVADPVYFTGGTGQLAGIVANDNPNILPANTGYLISVVAANGQVIVPQFQTQLNFANGASQDLSALAPVASVTTAYQYLPLPSGTPAAGTAPIATGSGQASAWTPVLPLSGGTMTGPVAMSGQKITGLANGSAATDAATFGQVTNLPTPSQMGILAWNYPSVLALGGSAAASPGVVYLARIPLYGAPISVTNILVAVQTAGSGLTSGQNFAGLFDNTGAKIGGTADQTTPWASTGLKTMALSGGPFTGSWPFVYAVIVPNGTTPPAFARLGGGSAAQALITLSSSGSSMPFASNGSGSALPASLTYSSNSATNSQPFWVGLS